MRFRLQEGGVEHLEEGGNGSMESKALGDNVPRMSLWWEGWVGGWVEGDAGWAQDFLELLFDSCSRSTQSRRPCVIKTYSDVYLCYELPVLGCLF